MDTEKMIEAFVSSFVGCFLAIAIIFVIAMFLLLPAIDSIYETTRTKIISEISGYSLKCSGNQEQFTNFTIDINGEKMFCGFYEIKKDLNFGFLQ